MEAIEINKKKTEAKTQPGGNAIKFSLNKNNN